MRRVTDIDIDIHFRDVDPNVAVTGQFQGSIVVEAILDIACIGNVETLKNAQKHPERYRDLIVRVAGYSDYFNDLGEDLQNEIIKRTEHEADR